MVDFGCISGPAIELVKWAAPTIKRLFSYLCCFTCIIKELEEEVGHLDYHTSVLRDQVDSDKNKGREEIYKDVDTWLTKSVSITRRKDKILAEATEAQSGCWNYGKRVSLTKEAKETAEPLQSSLKNATSRLFPVRRLYLQLH